MGLTLSNLPQSLARQEVLEAPHLPAEGQTLDQVIAAHSYIALSQVLAYPKHQKDLPCLPSHI